MFKIFIITGRTSAKELVGIGQCTLRVAKERLVSEAMFQKGEANAIRAQIGQLSKNFQTLLADIQAKHEAKVAGMESQASSAKATAEKLTTKAGKVDQALQDLANGL